MESEDSIKLAVSEMAIGCQRLLNADYVIATGPLPIYDPAGSDVPEFWYALVTPAGLSIRSSPYAGNPDILKVLSAKRALNWVAAEHRWGPQRMLEFNFVAAATRKSVNSNMPIGLLGSKLSTARCVLDVPHGRTPSCPPATTSAPSGVTPREYRKSFDPP